MDMVYLFLEQSNIDVNGGPPLASVAGSGHHDKVRLLLDQAHIDKEAPLARLQKVAMRV